MRTLVFSLLLLAVVGEVQAQHPVLNELMASNTETLADDDGDFSDWIELYNPTGADILLGGYGLSDEEGEPFKWVIPSQTLTAGDYALFFASAKDRAGTNGLWETVIDWGDAWRYRAGTSEPPATWTDPGFDDAGWNTGPSGFGYGDGDDATPFSSSTLVHYVRTTFSIDDPQAVNGALFHVHYDDAFVAYLNGVEIARAGIGTPGVRPTYQEGALTDHEAQNVLGQLPDEFEIDTDLLQPGENVLAVQIHNVSTTSSDLSLIPFLSLGLSTPPASPRGPSTHLVPFFERLPHANFKLSSGGETLYLTGPDGVRVDEIEIPALPPDVSYGRTPDGSAAWTLLTTATPQAPNPSTGIADISAAPAFDQASGFYANAISVQLSADPPEAPIYFTLDGSEPTMTNSARYTQPLTLSETTVIRARTFTPGLIPSPITTHTYLVGETQNLPTIAISTDPENLWDWNTGIYVLGPNADPQPPNRGANFWQDWEIPVHVAFYETDGELAFSTDAGARIVGGYTRSSPQKSLALFARGRYGDSAFEHQIFPDRPYDSYQAVTLRNAGNDWSRAHFRDGFMQSLVTEADIDGLAFRPAVVFLNGEYWGIQNLREKPNEHYLASLHDVDADALDLLEGNADVIEGDNADYLALLNFMATSNMASDDVYAEVRRQIDINNFIDYQVTQIFINNRDWPGNNIKFWRPHEDGRWRWILFDTDFGFGIYGNLEYEENGIAFATDPNGPDWPNPPWSTFVLRRLLENPDFERAFINRFADFLNVHFTTDRMEEALDAIIDTMDEEIPRHMARWGAQGGPWESHINVIRTFAHQRRAPLLRHWRNYFALAALQPITLDVATAGTGTIRINREMVTAFPWTGDYFPRVPVTLTAEPAPGYRFVEWSGAAQSTDRVLTIDPVNSPSVTAHFAPISGSAAPVVINEIQYHPPDDADTGDWVELLNRSPEAFDLSGWALMDAQEDHAFTLPEGTTIAPKSYLVLTQEPDAFAAVHPDVPSLGGWDFGFSQAGDHVRILDADGVLVDSLTFDDDTPWPSEADGDGPSLELIESAHDNANPANWSFSRVMGGTPGALNTVGVPVDATPQPTLPQTYTLEAAYPNPFRDHVTFSYSLPEAGRVELRVYNTLGQQVATLINTDQAAGRQRIRWSAADAAPGLYLVQLRVAGTLKANRSVLRIR